MIWRKEKRCEKTDYQWMCLKAIDGSVREIMLHCYNAASKIGYVPKSLKNVIIAIVYKSKGVRECDNYRGLSMMNSIGKIFEQLLQKRLAKFLEDTGVLPTTQFGFRAERGTEQS